ncbi:hypothetical protein [Rhodoferax sp. AJA081-3]|uniref:hypothetical protein n=1 Tax=Rhodoferax sp. AJA081-3 TaxID=2752316 RepID=UPI001FD7B559|nr:hypothetical protein [Rhodoferax sp. AJA081-3]
MESDSVESLQPALSPSMPDMRQAPQKQAMKALGGMAQVVRERLIKPASSATDGMSVRASLRLAFAVVVAGPWSLVCFRCSRWGA